ncbi:hypothetical protein IFR05_006042 [Cadophora sp. M221]|nr:hypothetical protein IFR05_006042 [Cadophora sp. M221]
MATFHPFPRLVIEFRAQIWALATEERVLVVTDTKSPRGGGTTTPAPAVTRACRESRECCSYQKSFIYPHEPCYVWANFDHDIIHLTSDFLWALPASEVKHLRMELIYDPREIEDERTKYCREFRKFPRLESLDLLVPKELRFYAQYMEDIYFGACPLKDVRMASNYTGEWIDEETWRQYWDYIESWGGTELDSMSRLADDDETYESRLEGMYKIQMPRPAINLDYLPPSMARTPPRV